MAKRTAVEIKTPDGVAEGWLIRPDTDGAFPGVLFLTDIGGISEENTLMAARVADAGYFVLMPNVFYRWGKPPMFDFSWPLGSPEMMKRRGELATPLTPAAVERDMNAFIDFLAAQPGVGPGKFGIVGYCFTGAHAMRGAAARPDKIGVVASFHGSRLYTSGADSPHTVLPRIKAALYFGHAVKDPMMDEAAIAGFERALKAWGGSFESEIYEGARHGWTTPGRPAIYHHDQAERAHAKLVASFDAHLNSRSPP